MGPDARRPSSTTPPLEYPPIDISTWAIMFAERHGVMRDWVPSSARWDVLLTPTWTQPPFPTALTSESLDEPEHPVADPARTAGQPPRAAGGSRAGRRGGWTAGGRAAHRGHVSPTSSRSTSPRSSKTASACSRRSIPSHGVTRPPRSRWTCPAARVRRRAATGVGRRRRGAPHRSPAARPGPGALLAAVAPGPIASASTARPTSPEAAPRSRRRPRRATSGSTAESKGVVLTHTALDASAVATQRRLGVSDDDHWLACLPLAHIGGLPSWSGRCDRGPRSPSTPASIQRPSWRAARRWSHSSRRRSPASIRQCFGSSCSAVQRPGRPALQHRHHLRDDRDRKRRRL